MTNNTLNKMIYVLTNFTLEQMNMLQPKTLNVDSDMQLHLTLAWSADLMLQAARIITAHVECVIRNNTASIPRAQKRLLGVRFSHPGLDDVGLGKILNDPLVKASIPASYRKKIGQPLVAFKYDVAIKTKWHNTRKYAHMSTAELDIIRTQAHDCHAIEDSYKRMGHLRTSDPSILPGHTLPQICTMGTRFRRSAVCNTLTITSKADIRSSLQSSVTDFARQAEVRASMNGCMNEWLQLVLQRIDIVLEAITEGTCVQQTHPLYIH